MFLRGWKLHYHKIEKARENYNKFDFNLDEWREAVASARKYNEEKVLNKGATDKTAARALYIDKQSNLIRQVDIANARIIHCNWRGQIISWG